MIARFSCIFFVILLAGCSSRQPDSSASSNTSNPPDVVTSEALSLVGTPYLYGGTSPETGFDCSGLVGYVYSDSLNINLPRTTQALSRMSGSEVSRDKLQSGDLIFFATSSSHKVSHVGIYIGDNRFVHAPSSGSVVRVDTLSNPYWTKAYLSAKRITS